MENNELDNEKEQEQPLEENNSVTNENISDENISIPNCLALTVQKDYKLSIAKNVFFKSIRSTFKVAFSVFALNLLKLFL